jgi:hypothetical protein
MSSRSTATRYNPGSAFPRRRAYVNPRGDEEPFANDKYLAPDDDVALILNAAPLIAEIGSLSAIAGVGSYSA